MNHSYGTWPENNSYFALSIDFGFGVVVLMIWALQLPYALLMFGCSMVETVLCQWELGVYLLGLGLEGV